MDRGIKIDTGNVSIVREPDRRWVDAECNYGDFNIGDDVFVARMMFRKCNSNVANISSGNNFPALIRIEIFQVGKGKVFSYDCKGALNYPYLNRVETGVGDPDDEIINNGYDFAPYAYYEHCDERQRYEHHRADIIHRYSGSYWLDISGCYKLCSNPSNTIVLSLHEEFKGERASVHCFDKKLILKHDSNNGSFKVVKETEFTKRY